MIPGNSESSKQIGMGNGFSATEQNREISQLCLIEFSSVLNQSLQWGI